MPGGRWTQHTWVLLGGKGNQKGKSASVAPSFSAMVEATAGWVTGVSLWPSSAV